MGSLPLRQSDAARWTKAAWGATALAGAAAVILFVLPSPRVKVDPSATGEAPIAAAPEKPRRHPTDDLGVQNWSALTSTMMTIEGQQPELEQWRRMIEKQRAEQARVAAENAPAGTTGASEPAPAFAPSWSYVGLLWNGRTPLAIMNVDGRQTLVAAGDRPGPKDEFVVDSIDAQRVVLVRGKSRYEIKRQASGRGTLLMSDASVEPGRLADPADGVFGDRTGISRRAGGAPGVAGRSRNNQR